jgi:hypothetical protein
MAIVQAWGAGLCAPYSSLEPSDTFCLSLPFCVHKEAGPKEGGSWETAIRFQLVFLQLVQQTGGWKTGEKSDMFTPPPALELPVTAPFHMTTLTTVTAGQPVAPSPGSHWNWGTPYPPTIAQPYAIMTCHYACYLGSPSPFSLFVFLTLTTLLSSLIIISFLFETLGVHLVFHQTSLV